jgi:hypothetical protein
MVKRGLVLIVILLIGFVLAAPNLLFVEPTPEDNLYLKITNSTINVSLNNDENTSVFLDWNRDLLGYWSFDYYNSTGVYDNSSYSNFGIFEGNLTSSNITSGIRGNALEFNGNDSYIVLDSKIDLISYINWTISSWVNVKSISDSFDNVLGGHTMAIASNNEVRSYDGSGWIVSDGTISLGEWAHVSLACDGTNDVITFYVNGVNDSSKSYNCDGYSDNRVTTIGGYSLSQGFNFNGTIDEVMIFNRTLSAEEILYIYNSTESLIEFSFSNLSDGTYPYSVYAINGSGEMEIQSRTLGIDSTPTGIDFVFPTPANELYLKITNPVINVSITQPENKSVWIDWDNSLVGYWSFDYYNSTGVFDNSSYGNFGNFEGNLSEENLTAGKRGYGLEFDGESDYVDVIFDNSLNLNSTNFTYSAWIKTTTSSAPNTIIGFASNVGPQFRVNGDGTLELLKQSMASIGSSTGTFSNDEWNHVLVTYDTSGNYEFYINGVSSGSGINLQSFSDSDLNIGAGVNGAFEEFKGKIDEVMIFNRSLSQEEILYLYNSTSSTFEYSLSNLNEGESYEYSVYSMDIGGNMEIISRNFTVDTTPTGLELIFPTPENELYTKITSQTINATFTDSTNKSVWIDWNNSLVGYWSFDYVNSTGIYDNSSYENHGEFQSGINLEDLVSGARGQGINYEGLHQGIKIGNSEELNLWENFTISAWVNRIEEGGDYDIIYSRSVYKFWVSPIGGSLYLQQGYSPHGTVSTSGGVPLNQWTHVLVTHNSSNFTKLYINGNLEQTGNLGFYNSPSSNTYLGYHNGERLNNSIDEVMAFNRVLSDEEILYLYNSTSTNFEYSVSDLEEGVYDYSVYSIDNAGNMEIESREFTIDTTSAGLNFVFPTPPNSLYSRLTSQTINVTFDYPLNKSVWLDWNNSLVGYWSFDEYNSTGVFDNSSYGNFGEFGNDFSEDDLVRGERGQALKFDGVNDYLIVPYTPNFNFGENDFSVFGWFKVYNSDTGVVLSKRGANYGDGWALFYNGTDYYVDKLTNSSYNQIYFNENNNQEWKHLGFVRIGNNITLYVNGEYKLSSIDADNNVSVSNTRDLIFGNLLTSAGDWFNGTMDEVMIFNRSLSQEEILGIYNSTSSYFEFDRTGLTDGNYNYSVYSIDIAGNLEIESRSFSVDTIGPGLEIIYPSPTNELYTKITSQTINATFTDSENKSVWIDWNDSLLGYWSFDYVNSTGIFDNSSNEYHGQYKGNMNLDKLVAGPRGQGMWFNDSEGDYIDLTNSNEFDLMDFSISIWGYNTGNGGSYGTLISRTGTYKIWFSDDSYMVFQQGGNPGYSSFGSSNPVPLNEWHHFVFTHNSSNWTQIYIDGVLDNSGYLGLNPDSSATLKIGAILSGAEGLDGALDEVMFFNRVISPEEVLYLYNSTETNFEYSVLGLESSEYNYSVYAMDNAGNLEIESREFTVDTTPVIYDFLYPTPGDNLYTRLTNQTINISESNEENESIWIDWEDSLLGYWSFDYYNSTGVYDNSSYGNFGEFVGNLGEENLSTGARGQGIKIDNNESYIEVNESEIDWGQTNSFTVSFWNKPLGPTSGTGAYYAFLGRGLNGPWGFFSNTESEPSSIYFRVYNSTGYSRNSVASDVITVGEWNHVVGRYNGTHLNVFVNGVKESSSEFSGPVNNSGTDFQIGRIPDRESYYMNGTVDEVMIFNRSLSQQEILAIYNSTSSNFEYSVSNLEEGSYNYSIYAMDRAGNLGIEERTFTVDTTPTGLSLVYPTPADGLYSHLTNQTINATFTYPENKSTWIDWDNSLVGYWSFDYYNSTGIFDNSSYGNFGVFDTNISLDNLVTGVRGQALEFSINDDMNVNLGTSNSLYTSGNMTLSFWMKSYSDSPYATFYCRRDSFYVAQMSGWDIMIQQGNNPWDTVHSGAGTITQNQWHNIVITHREDNWTEIYIDGDLKINESLEFLPDETGTAYLGGCTPDSGLLNGSLDEVMIFNRTLSYSEILYLYNSTSTNFEYSLSDLEEGNYNYSVYSIDNAGNLEIESREFTVDVIPVGINFIYPTPADELYTFLTSHTINVSFSEPENKSSWIDWDNSLIGYWSFDYYNSTGVYDNSSYGNFGVFDNMNLNSLSGGKRGSSISFEGQSGINILNSFSLDSATGPGKPRTWGYWVKPNKVHSNNILTDKSNFVGDGFWSEFGSGNLLRGGVSEINYVSGPSLNVGQWYSVFFVYNGTHTFLYVDGVLVGGPNLQTAPAYNNNALQIGVCYDPVDHNLTAEMDEVMIFNRSLSQEEILAIYNSTSSNFEYSVSNLEEGSYNYSIYAMDNAGNLEIESRTLNIDTTGPGLELVFPTPENEIYTTITNHTVNFTFEEPLNKSFWIDWNNSLIGYWSFDYINSSGVFGNSSYERFGIFGEETSLNEKNVTKGVRGQALQMNGPGNYVILPFDKPYGSENFTLSIWAKSLLPNMGGWGAIFGFSGIYTSGPVIYYDRFMADNGTEGIYLNYGGSSIEEEWNHFLITNDASNRSIKAYINGVYTTKTYYTGNIYDSSSSMVIGGPGWSFNGSIDEAMVFNRVLTIEEISYLYNSTLSEFSFDKTDLNDSVYPYQIYSIDNAGNLEIESREFTVDTTDPVISFVSPSLPNSGGSNGTFEFNVTVEDLTQTSSWYDINNSLIGYWSFDYTNSTGVFDNSTHSNSSSFGLFNGDISEENINFSRRGKGAYFDGDGDYIEIVNSSRFNFTNEDFSFGGWIKRDAVPYEGGEHPIGKGNSGGITPYVIWMHDFRYNFLIGEEGCSGWEATQSVQTPVLQNETWYHIMAVKDGTVARIYLDGVEVDSSDIGTDTICSRENSFIVGSGNSHDGTSTSGDFPGWIDEVMVFNRSLSSTEVLALYDSTSNGFYNSYNELENGTRSYYFSSVDSAGNFVKYSREFDVDFTNPLISYTSPTPANNSFNGRLIINATVYDRNLKNVTFNFGGSSYELNITQEYSLNSKNYSEIWINATRVDNITNQWDLIITRDNLALGESYLYNVEIYDDGNNYNSTLERTINGNNPPMFFSITQFPNLTLDMDPGVLINLTVNVTDIDSDIDSYLLQWKKSGENWTNASLTELSGTSSSKIVFGNFTPTEEGIYTYRFFANDSFGVANYTQDRNISVYWDCEWSVNSSFDALAGYGENKRLGTLVIENLGDPEFANNNCTLNFRTTYDLEEGRVYLNGITWKPQNFLNLEAKDSFEILVNVTFGSEFTQEDLTITTTELGGISANTSAQTTATLITLSSGPYLYNEITESPTVVYLTPQTFDLEGYVRNLMGSPEPNETNTAYNVSFYWTLPEGFSGTSSTVNYENLSENNVNTDSNTISFSDLTSFMPGVKTFYLVSEGVNNTGQSIIDSNGNTKINDSVNINFLCYSVPDSVCVSECGNSLDPDCPVETVTIETVINEGGGGGGGSSEKAFEISEDRFELVIGEKQEFPLKIENLMNYPKKNVKVTARNLGEAEIEISPSIIKNLPAKSTKEVQVILLSKKYLVQGMYEIIFDIEGQIDKDGQLTNFKEKKIMQLFLVEISKEDAQNLLNDSFKILEKMQEENLRTDSIKNYIEKMNSSLNILDYGSVEENYKGLYELFEVATESKNLIQELEESISRSEYNGINVLESKKTFFVAKSAFLRGDYHLAYQKVKEAQLTYALETKGKFNVLRYIQNEPDKALLILASFILFIFTVTIISKYFIYKRKIKLLALEEKLFLELMKVVQKQCFEENKLSMGQYGEAIAQYEFKLSKAVQKRVRYESKLVNLLNFRGKKSALLHEQKRLINLIKEIQSDYLIKGKLETRIYEGMVKSYSSRLTEVEERLIYLEASKALRGKGFFKALFNGGKNEVN